MRNGDSLARRPAISICAVNRVNLTAGGMCRRERERERGGVAAGVGFEGQRVS